MVERLLDNRDSTEAALRKMVVESKAKRSKSNKDNELPVQLRAFTEEEWQLAEDFHTLFKPMLKLTETLCGDKYATASMLIPSIRTTINKLKNITLSSAYSARVNLKNKIILKLIRFTVGLFL